jgi:hypothetical protein
MAGLLRVSGVSSRDRHFRGLATNRRQFIDEKQNLWYSVCMSVKGRCKRSSRDRTASLASPGERGAKFFPRFSARNPLKRIDSDEKIQEKPRILKAEFDRNSEKSGGIRENPRKSKGS